MKNLSIASNNLQQRKAQSKTKNSMDQPLFDTYTNSIEIKQNIFDPGSTIHSRKNSKQAKQVSFNLP